jgi:hypothetical protein
MTAGHQEYESGWQCEGDAHTEAVCDRAPDRVPDEDAEWDPNDQPADRERGGLPGPLCKGGTAENYLTTCAADSPRAASR